MATITTPSGSTRTSDELSSLAQELDDVRTSLARDSADITVRLTEDVEDDEYNATFYVDFGEGGEQELGRSIAVSFGDGYDVEASVDVEAAVRDVSSDAFDILADAVEALRGAAALDAAPAAAVTDADATGYSVEDLLAAAYRRVGRGPGDPASNALYSTLSAARELAGIVPNKDTRRDWAAVKPTTPEAPDVSGLYVAAFNAERQPGGRGETLPVADLRRGDEVTGDVFGVILDAFVQPGYLPTDSRFTVIMRPPNYPSTLNRVDVSRATSYYARRTFAQTGPTVAEMARANYDAERTLSDMSDDLATFAPDAA